jgi:hypothetical protein
MDFFSWVQGVVKIVGASGNIAEVNLAGEQLVAVAQPATPPGKTPVKEGGIVVVTKKGGTDEFDYIIPNGETLTLQQLEFSGYLTVDSGNPLQTKCALKWQPNGNTTGEELVSVLYLQGTSEAVRNFPSTEVFVGDGTARLRLEIVNESKEHAEVFRLIRGFY